MTGEKELTLKPILPSVFLGSAGISGRPIELANSREVDTRPEVFQPSRLIWLQSDRERVYMSKREAAAVRMRFRER